MNDDQTDKLPERSEFLSGRHSSVRRREPAAGGLDGRGSTAFDPNFSTWKSLAAVRAREPGTLILGREISTTPPGAGARDYGFERGLGRPAPRSHQFGQFGKEATVVGGAAHGEAQATVV